MSVAEQPERLAVRTAYAYAPSPDGVALHRAKTIVTKRRGRLVRTSLAVADVIGLVFAFVAVQLAFHDRGANDAVSMEAEIVLLIGTLPAWIVLAHLYGLYDHDEERADHSTLDEIVSVFHLISIGSWLLLAAAAVTGLARPDLIRMAAFWAVSIAAISTARATARAVCRRRPEYLQNTVIVGAGEVGQRIGRKFAQHPEYGINVVGFVDRAPRARPQRLGPAALLGPPERLPLIVRRFQIDRVVVAFSTEPDDETLEQIRALEGLDVQVDIVPRLFELVGPQADMHSVEGLPLLGVPPVRLGSIARAKKRAFDIVFATIGLLVLAPVFLLAAVAIKLESRGPVFFRQVRMGSGDRTFRIFKFRSMTLDADSRKAEVAHLNKHAAGDGKMFKIADDPRVTRVGRVLRKTSIDEFPQLINVLKGEMTLVGPRPLILEEDQHVVAWARRRLDLKPGMTGLWQVLGRSAIPFEEMVRLDYLYVKSWSIWRDCVLIFKTVPALLRGERADV